MITPAPSRFGRGKLMVSRQLGQSYKGLPLCSLFEELCESGSVSIAHLGDFRSHKPARLSVHTNAVAGNRRQDGRDDPAGQIHGNVQWATRSLQLKRPGCPLYVTVNLTSGVIAAVLATVTCDRVGMNGQASWFVGAKITQMSDADAARLAQFLEKRAQGQPFVALT